MPNTVLEAPPFPLALLDRVLEHPRPADLIPGALIEILEGYFKGQLAEVEFTTNTHTRVVTIETLSKLKLELPLHYVCPAKPPRRDPEEKLLRQLSELHSMNSFTLNVPSNLEEHDFWVQQGWIWFQGSCKYRDFAKAGHWCEFVANCWVLSTPSIYLKRSVLDSVHENSESMTVEEYEDGLKYKQRHKAVEAANCLRTQKFHPHPFVRATEVPFRNRLLNRFRSGRLTPSTGELKPVAELGVTDEIADFWMLPTIPTNLLNDGKIEMWQWGFLADRFQVELE